MNRQEALTSLANSLQPTMQAAGLSVVTKKDAQQKSTVISTENDKTMVTYKGDAGEVVLELTGDVLKVLCRNPDDAAAKTVATELFDCEADGFSGKDIKSAANETAESVGKFFGSDVIYDEGKGKTAKKSDAVAKPAQKSAASAEIKQAKKNAGDSYSPIQLALRIESIYPELKGKAEENISQYGKFLPEQYFEEYGTEKVIGTIRNNDKGVMKRLFKMFNSYYEDGEKDTQSLIAVSVLGIPFSKEPELLEKCKGYMDEEELGPVVEQVTQYLQKGPGQRKLKKYENPKAYKPTWKEKRKKAMSNMGQLTK